ncbi:MAG TPA: EscU/YscU/HrcU family type III secretion system export apparatus switch protein, partial [Rhodocyclaceae bacterium]|nr:EscU/YscU/HrcU family type III secretion system export apparatus switch protein [Rhodocyclaceae bacterium]
LRMTKEEVKRENKEQEGDPHVKARIRRVQMEMARKRMMAEVPKADVVVTNPTHFSVALKYDAERMNAPVVVAKGRGDVALKIRELAQQHGVPLLEAPPLARALYTHCELEEAVPAALYTAVAEVMAYVYQLNEWMSKGGDAPRVPTALAVPDGLDPGAA